MATPVVQVTGINHVVLHVSDLDAALEFYIGALGFTDRNGGGNIGRRASFLRCGDQGLDLFEVEGPVKAGTDLNHMALNIEAAGVEEVVEKLTAAGIESSEPTRRNSVFIQDPDGHRIEMLPRNSLERTREREAVQSAS